MSDGIWMTLGGALLLVLTGEAALHSEAAAGLLAAALWLAVVATAVK